MTKKQTNFKPKREIIRQPRSPWITFVMNEQQRLNLPLPELTKRLAPVWKAMDDNARKPYQELYAQDLARYQEDRQHISKEDQKALRAHRRIKRRNVASPRCNISPFICFSSYCRPLLKKDFPNATVPELASMIGVKWKQLSTEEQKPFYDLAKCKPKQKSENIVVEMTEEKKTLLHLE
jgi:hypothetical protein